MKIFGFLLVALVCGRSADGAPPSGKAENSLEARERGEGWTMLFDGNTTAGWHSFRKSSFPAQGWKVTNGWLYCSGSGGDIVSSNLYDRFELRWEWRLAPGGNSGVKYFVTDDRPTALGHEYQLLDDAAHPDAKLAGGKRVTAAFYDVQAPSASLPVKRMGEINESRVLVRGNHVEHWLNGVKALEYDCGSPEIKAAISQSKFKTTPGFGLPTRGHILLQAHRSEVWFRNIKIRELPK